MVHGCHTLFTSVVNSRHGCILRIGFDTSPPQPHPAILHTPSLYSPVLNCVLTILSLSDNSPLYLSELYQRAHVIYISGYSFTGRLFTRVPLCFSFFPMGHTPPFQLLLASFLQVPLRHSFSALPCNRLHRFYTLFPVRNETHCVQCATLPKGLLPLLCHTWLQLSSLVRFRHLNSGSLDWFPSTGFDAL